MKITVRVKHNYGLAQVYPVCEKAQLFAEIAGTKTLTRPTLQLINKLGYLLDIQREWESNPLENLTS